MQHVFRSWSALFIAIIALSFPHGVFAASVATTSFEGTNSTAPINGVAIDSTGDGEGWSGNWIATMQSAESKYDNSVSHTGSWSLLQDTSGTTNEPKVSRILNTAIANGSVTAYLMKDKTNRNNDGIRLYRGGLSDTNLVAQVYFTPTVSGNGNLQALDGSTETIIGYGVQATSTWYQIKIELNSYSQTYDVYMDGTRLNTSPLAFHSIQPGVDRIQILSNNTNNDSPGTKLWVDDITAHASAGTSFETTDGSTTPTTGSLVAETGDGEGWNGGWIATMQGEDTQYATSTVHSGAWSLLQNTSGTHNEPKVDRLFETPLASGSVTLYMQKDSTNRSADGVRLYSGGVSVGNLALEVYFNATSTGNGDLLAINNTEETVIASGVQAANTWYRVKIIFDASTDTYDVYLDGTKINPSPLNFYNNLDTIDRIQILSNDTEIPGVSPIGAKLWVDDLQV